MSDFDYRQHKIIGVARRKFQGDLHASIYPLGYQDKNFHFQPFKEDELSKLFPYNGTIFGYKFRDSLIDELIILQVRESEKIDDPTKDVFSADYSGAKIDKYDHIPILNIDKQALIEAINQGENNRYYKAENRIYQIIKSDLQRGIVKYWTIEDNLFEANPYLCRFQEDIYLIRDNINYAFNFSDIWANEKIVGFVINLIKNYNVDPQNISTISEGLIQKLGLPLQILQFRFDKFNALLSSITLTQRNILDLASNSILSDVLQRSIKEYESDYIKLYEDHYSETIKKMELSRAQKLADIEKECELKRKAHLLKLESITDEVNKNKIKLSKISETIEEKKAEAEALEQRLTEIEWHKSRLVEDFSVIKEVIGGQQNSKQSFRSSIESVTCHGEPIFEFDDFCDHILAHLLRNRFSENSAMEISLDISRLFVAKNADGKNLSVVLVPDLKIFKSLIGAVGRYKLCSVGVAPNWKSYDDLYNNALGEMIVSARSDPDEIHIVLLQNMNLSYIPSYMQPINDVLIGISNKLPGDHNSLGIPSNLWIFGTRTCLGEESIPISKSNIEEYGCLKNKDYTYSEGKTLVVPESKFITMDFVNTQREEELRYRSYPESYLD